MRMTFKMYDKNLSYYIIILRLNVIDLYLVQKETK
jgi:hypothetical protein